MTNPIRAQGNPETSTLTIADGLGILSLVTVLLLVSVLHSRHTMFSADEIMTLYVLRQPNFHSLLEMWRAGIDSSGIWFYVFARPWVAMFGASEISLRFYSASGIAAAAAIVWITARRYYSFLPVAAAVTFVFASSHVIRWQLAYGRTYGVFMFAAALVIYLIFRGEDVPRPGPVFLLATVGAYTLLMGSHILGAVYGSMFLAVQVALDVRSRRFRPWLYISAACGYAVVLFSLTNIQATAVLGRPVFWTIRPKLKDLLTGTNMFDHRVTGGLALVVLILFLHFRLRRLRTPVYVLLLAFALLDVFFFVYSRLTTSIYVDRYLMPFGFAAILLLCELLTQLRDADAPMPGFRHWLPVLVLAAAVAGFFVPRLQRPWFPFPNYTLGFIDSLPAGLPIVDADAASFIELEFYQHDSLHRPLLFPVDLPVALDPENIGGVSGTKEIANLGDKGFYTSDVVSTSSVVDSSRSFVLISSGPDLWLRRRILTDPRFSAVKRSSYPIGMNQSLDVWLVQAH